ncbi:MAG: hypothetical protein Q4B54_10655, partial [Coriobacteriales bacterium]|nr:hypothetical protein [Coriobacteriales bacterium]
MMVQARDKNLVGGTRVIRLAGMRVFLPLLLMLAVALVLGVPARSALADDASVTTGIKISKQGGKTHEYVAYKLLSGSVSNGKIT